MMSYACAVRRLLDYGLASTSECARASASVLFYAFNPRCYPLRAHQWAHLDAPARAAATVVLDAFRSTGIPPQSVVPEALDLLEQLIHKHAIAH
jgi:hypothetical protein